MAEPKECQTQAYNARRSELRLCALPAPFDDLRSYIFEPPLLPAGNADERDCSAQSLRPHPKRIVSAFWAP